VEGEQTMDLLMHYAQSGLMEAEQLMRKQPEMFSVDEIMDFAANKVVLSKAPDVLEDYKKKVREFEQINVKINDILDECDSITARFDERKNAKHSEKNIENSTGKIDPSMIRITADGEMIIKKTKKVVIELKKSEDY
jgi:hypothetical protein